MPHKDPEARRAYAAAWREKNANERRTYNQTYREKNGDRLRANRKLWRAKNRERRATYRETKKPEFLIYHAKNRAKKRGIAFEITASDLLWPTHCPVFGFELDYGARKSLQNNAPTLDRIDPAKGYVKGNVQVISWRANRLKADATVEEIRRLAAYLEVFC